MAMPITLIISGGGKMGGALLSGLLRSAWADADEIAVIEPNADRRAELADAYPELGVFNAPEEGMLSGPGDRMTGAVLAVKPEAAEGACRVLGAVGVTRVLSIVAGIPCFRLEAALGGEPEHRQGVAGHEVPELIENAVVGQVMLGRGDGHVPAVQHGRGVQRRAGRDADPRLLVRPPVQVADHDRDAVQAFPRECGAQLFEGRDGGVDE